MEIEDQDDLINNDIEYKKGIDNEDNLIEEIGQNPPSNYNHSSFQPNIIINYL